MDFTVSDEVTSVQQLSAQILGDFSEVDKLKAIEQQDEVFDAKLWQALAEAGLLGLDIPADQGGMDLGFFSLTTLCEEVGRTVAPVPPRCPTPTARRRSRTGKIRASWAPSVAWATSPPA